MTVAASMTTLPPIVYARPLRFRADRFCLCRCFGAGRRRNSWIDCRALTPVERNAIRSGRAYLVVEFAGEGAPTVTCRIAKRPGHGQGT